jgi:hypothetical protein
MDTIGWFIATTHQLLGHDKTANMIGQPVFSGDHDNCPMCIYEKNPTDENKFYVELAIGGRP